MSMTHRGKHGHIYVARVEMNGVEPYAGPALKVGFTEDVRHRMYQLTGTLITSERGTVEQEQHLVRRCSLYCRHPRWREWFDLTVWPTLAVAWEQMFGYEPLNEPAPAHRQGWWAKGGLA